MENKGIKLFGEMLKKLPLLSSEISVADEIQLAKSLAIIAIEHEYLSNRVLIFNLRSCGVIEREKVYLSRIQGLIDEEQKIKLEIENI